MEDRLLPILHKNDLSVPSILSRHSFKRRRKLIATADVSNESSEWVVNIPLCPMLSALCAMHYALSAYPFFPDLLDVTPRTRKRRITV